MNWSFALALAAFLTVTGGLLALLFIPVVREWRRPTDAAALEIAAEYTTDIEHFAKRFQARALAALRNPGAANGFGFFNGSPSQLASDASRPLIARSDLDSAKALRVHQPLYIAGRLRAGGGSRFSALYVAGDLDLGCDSCITQWAHAEGVARLREQCGAVGRLSAGVAVELAGGCWFERIRAPLVRAGGAGADRLAPNLFAPQLCASMLELPGAVQQSASTYLVDGDCALPPGRRFTGSLVVRGFLTIDAHTTVVGDIKARDGVRIGHRAVVEGAVTCGSRVYVLPEARAFGPLVCESDVRVGARAVVGLPSAPTTLSARTIILEPGALVHGEIRAWVLGMVKAPA